MSNSTTFDLLESHPFTEVYNLLNRFRNGVWLLGIPSGLFGAIDRITAAFADGYVSAIEFIQFVTAILCLMGWLYLKPKPDVDSEVTLLQEHHQLTGLEETYLETAQSRMAELQKQHMIRQEYVLPFSYVCQIYHLLNLKHLESVHSFSLNNLRVIQVNHMQTTDIGGVVKFQTMLDSPFNALRIWRQPVVEVELTLHTPFTVELSIPVYNGKRMTVIFNAIPLNNTQHKLFIDIYSDLKWYKPFLQLLLHAASCLTLFEDLPYLQALAKRKIYRLVQLDRIPNHETMWLFKRFAALYGLTIAPGQAIEAAE
ncbi:MAG: hypothetical protein KME45_30440 [Stenomitos rutilans HA7619-LM2]|jgi:hypothetical protein|nr:hypothetical protein [Stenomitos rutilans HA7619-LM2]